MNCYLRRRTPPELRVARTRYDVIVDHAGCLHERIADCRTDKFEAALQQIATHDVGFGCARGNLGHGSPAILNWFAIDEVPHISIESSEFFAHGEKCLCVPDCGRDFQSIP